MEIRCPECDFSREVKEEDIPEKSLRVTCPQCHHLFVFRDQRTAAEDPAALRDSLAKAFGSVLKQHDQKPQAAQGRPQAQDAPPPAQSQPFSPHTTAHSMQHPVRQTVEVPFEHLEKYGFWGGLIETTQRIVLSPRLFFSTIPLDAGQTKPLIFNLLMMGLYALFQMLWAAAQWDILYYFREVPLVAQLLKETPANVVTFIFSVLLSLPFAVILAYLYSAVIHLALVVFQCGSGGFEGTFRAITYSSAPYFLACIPFGGYLLAWLWSLYIAFIALVEVHNSSAVRVGLALFSLFVTVLVLVFFLALFVVSLLEPQGVSY